MTWRTLKEFIARLSDAELDDTVQFVEPYDSAVILPVAAYFAEEKISVDQELIQKGEAFLSC